MDIDFISDLHGHCPKLDGGDLLIIAGDLTARDTPLEYTHFFNWLMKQNYTRKIIIAGNHDNEIEGGLDLDFKSIGIEYLEDSGTEFEGFKIWGTPWSLKFPEMNLNCAAFTGDEHLLKTKYEIIPNDIDILISHTPFHCMLDQNKEGYHCGSRSLRDAVDRIQPRFFVCGHIHEQGGNQIMYKHQGRNTWCMNASIMNEYYHPVNEPIGIEGLLKS